ncbi:MAG: hypothetical protein E7626_04510 [Ruminococcaceae bacterium]|nr:hypothetical protein [Oscillospiraceae bacterium]
MNITVNEGLSYIYGEEGRSKAFNISMGETAEFLKRFENPEIFINGKKKIATIIVGDTSNKAYKEAVKGLDNSHFKIVVKTCRNLATILVCGNTEYALMSGIEYFISKYFNEKTGGKAEVSTEIVEKFADLEKESSLIITSDRAVRDPQIFVKDGVYYMFGSHMASHYGMCTSTDLEHWSEPVSVCKIPEGKYLLDQQRCFWAPECHYYKGRYYMFATFKNPETLHRGSAVFGSDNIEGPYTLVTDGLMTPEDWDAIDATFYVDDNGQPWCVFVHEWTCMPDKVGSMCVVKMKDDLSGFDGEIIEVFKAKDPVWAKGGVTDGPFIYKMSETGSLIMLWSNQGSAGYLVGMARSASGNMEGPWVQLRPLLYSKLYGEEYDGGHGAFFKTNEGQLMLSIHAPNNPTNIILDQPASGRPCTAIFVPIEEDKELDMLRRVSGEDK